MPAARRSAQLIQFQKKHQYCSRELRLFLLLVPAPVVYLEAAVIHKVPESTHEPSIRLPCVKVQGSSVLVLLHKNCTKTHLIEASGLTSSEKLIPGNCRRH